MEEVVSTRSAEAVRDALAPGRRTPRWKSSPGRSTGATRMKKGEYPMNERQIARLIGLALGSLLTAGLVLNAFAN
jgi:hypothetical protein